MKTFVAAAIAGLLWGATPVAAAEPDIPDRIVPNPAQLRHIARDLSGGVYYVETRTLGRVGDTGYAWLMTVNQQPGSSPTFTRLVIDCPTRRYTEDWHTFYNADLQITGHEKSVVNIGIVGSAEDEVIDAACSGQALTPEHASFREAVDAAWALPTLIVEFEPGPVYYVTEAGADGTYEATWTRRGSSRTFDGHWRFEPTGQEFDDIVEFDRIYNGVLVVKRPGLGEYRFSMVNDVPIYGTASWVTDPDFGVMVSEVSPEEMYGDETFEELDSPSGSIDTPPSTHSLFWIEQGDDPVPLKVFFDENSRAAVPGSTNARVAWQFYAFSRPLDRGTPTTGAWIRMQYDCNAAPITWSPTGVTNVLAETGELTPLREATPQTFSAGDSTIGNQIANYVCRNQPMDLLAFMDRFTSIDEAIAEAKR